MPCASRLSAVRIFELARAGALRSGANFTAAGGGLDLRCRSSDHTIAFEGVARDEHGNNVAVDGVWEVTRSSAPRFGGSRPFFRCPLSGRAALALYFVAGKWGCGPAHRVYSAIEPLSPDRRLAYRIARLRGELGGDQDWCTPIPGRPPGMRRKRYKRIVAEIERATSLRMRFIWRGALNLYSARPLHPNQARAVHAARAKGEDPAQFRRAGRAAR